MWLAAFDFKGKERYIGSYFSAHTVKKNIIGLARETGFLKKEPGKL